MEDHKGCKTHGYRSINGRLEKLRVKVRYILISEPQGFAQAISNGGGLERGGVLRIRPEGVVISHERIERTELKISNITYTQLSTYSSIKINQSLNLK